MTTEAKKLAILKMFSCFPSLATAGETQIAAMLAGYLEMLQSRSSEAVSAACNRLLKRGGAFPPNAGEVYAEAEKIDSERDKLAEWRARGLKQISFSRDPIPRITYTRAQLADWSLIINGSGPYVMREDENGAPLTIPHGYPGAGQPVAYGYLTPAEVEAVKSARSRRPMREAAE